MGSCSPRLIVLDCQPSLLRGRSVTPCMPSWPPKDPTDIEVLSADFTRLTGGVALATVSAAASPNGSLGIVQATPNVTVAAVVVQGGTDGLNAIVVLTVTTTDGQIFRRGVQLPVVSMAPAGGSAPAWQGTVTTSDATPTIVGSIPVVGPAGSAVSLRGTVTARNTATGAAINWDVAALVEQAGTSGATVTQQSVTTFVADAGMTGCGLAVAVSGAVITLVGTGVAATSIDWSTGITATVT